MQPENMSPNYTMSWRDVP
ncbi:hypothetical protein [Nitrosospira sp. Nsp2]